jgi:hypothetical protein
MCVIRASGFGQKESQCRDPHWGLIMMVDYSPVDTLIKWQATRAWIG